MKSEESNIFYSLDDITPLKAMVTILVTLFSPLDLCKGMTSLTYIISINCENNLNLVGNRVAYTALIVTLVWDFSNYLD